MCCAIPREDATFFIIFFGMDDTRDNIVPVDVMVMVDVVVDVMACHLHHNFYLIGIGIKRDQ